MNSLLQCGHTIFHEKCKTCRAIQDDYYTQLEQEGFEDIEDVNHPQKLLKSWHSFKFPMMDLCQREAEDQYYYAALSLLQTFRFEKPIHKFIWALHCEGKSKRDIEKIISESQFEKKYKRESILNIISKIAEEIIR